MPRQCPPKAQPKPGALVEVLKEHGGVKQTIAALAPKESAGDRQERIDAESMRIKAWMDSGPAMTLDLSKEAHFVADEPALAIIAAGSDGALRIKVLPNVPTHTQLFGHARDWEEDEEVCGS